MHMIIAVLKGGLGNQLFQYACARALSLRNGEPVKFDVTGYIGAMTGDTPRQYLLSKFNIHNEMIATNEEVRIFKYPYGKISKGWRMVRTKLGLHNVGYVPRILKKKGDLYLDGFWQTERYFTDCADIIRKELTLKDPMSAEAIAYASLISSTPESVSLHVRRGDVARDSQTNPYYGICTPEYYTHALEYIGTHLKNPHIFIFSDDPAWVIENISIPFPFTVVSGKSIPDYEELSLMSMCTHHIIANSTFSWWGAWLNTNPKKIVIAPKRWITKYEIRHKDTVPKEWVRV